MNDDEQEEILHRLDERTEMMINQVEDQNEAIIQQRQRVSDTEDLAQKNRSILSGLTFGVSTVLTAIAGKLAGLISF